MKAEKSIRPGDHFIPVLAEHIAILMGTTLLARQASSEVMGETRAAPPWMGYEILDVPRFQFSVDAELGYKKFNGLEEMFSGNNHQKGNCP